MTARQDRRNAGTHRALANFEFSFATDQGRIADFDAGDIRDGVKLSRCPFKRNTQFACANDLRLDYWRRRFDRFACEGIARDHDHEHEPKKSLRCPLPSINYQLSTINLFVRGLAWVTRLARQYINHR